MSRNLEVALLAALLISVLALSACVAKPVAPPDSAPISTEKSAEPPAPAAMPAPAPAPEAMPAPAHAPSTSADRDQAYEDELIKRLELLRLQAAEAGSKPDGRPKTKKMAKANGSPHPPAPAAAKPIPGAAGSPAASAVHDPQAQAQRIDDYLNSLSSASYAFNPPSPIKVAKPVTMHFWLDPSTTTAQLSEALKQAVPRDAARVESGVTTWSPRMRATLSGPEFEIKPVPEGSEEQPVSPTQRTTWSWDVTPLVPGDNLVLHLRLQVVLPPEISPPKTITTLDKEIKVEVTWWWLFDNFFEKYWKWLFGGLGTAISGMAAWWWKNRKSVDSSRDQASR